MLSLSDSVHWKKEEFGKVPWTEYQILPSNLNASYLKFHMTAAQLESESLLTANIHLSEALKEKGYQTNYGEFTDGHDSV